MDKVIANNAITSVLASLKSLSLIVFCCGALLCSAVQAQGPENTVVVVNADSADSLAVANAYIELRDIPPVNVIYIKNVPRAKTSLQSTNSKNFEARILKPILNALRDRRIENQIDCIAYSSNFPTRINVKSQIDTHLGQTGRKSNKALHAPWASITSLTYFHRNAFGRRPDFFNLDANNFANPRGIKITANPFSGKDASQFSTAIKAMNAGDFDGAIEGLVKLARTHDKQVSVVYVLARCFALKNENEKAITTLKHARTLGFASKSMLATDKAFSRLRTLREFREFTDSMEDLPDGIAPTRSFSSGNFWGINGWANGTAQQGDKYTLSSVLAVVDKNASTLEDSLAALRASAMADGTAPAGNVYFAEHKDVRSRARKSQFIRAKQELESLGRTATIGAGIVPKADPQVFGATLGSSRINWKKSGSRFVPGAICDNLTSYGGLWGQSQTQVSEFLDAGAAGASGTVCEPYAIAPKFPSARWHAHYARGCTLAESFFQSVAGPSQLLLVGDPLCCPFGKFPDFQIGGLDDGDTVKGDFVLQVEPSPKSPKAARYEMFYDGVFLGVVSDPDKVEVATDAMNDGYHELRIVAVSDSSIVNRRSRKLGFVFDGKGQQVVLKIKKPRGRLGGEIVGQATSSIGERIEIRQNMRTLATVKSGKAFRIPVSRVGVGKSKLQAVVKLGNGTLVQSSPVEIQLQN